MKKAYLAVSLSVFVVSCFLLSLCFGTSRAESEEPAATSEETPTAGKMKSSPAEPVLPSQPRPELDPKLRTLPGRRPDLVITRVNAWERDLIRNPLPVLVYVVTVKNVGNEDAVFPPDTWIIGGPSQSKGEDLDTSRKTTNEKTQSELTIKPGETLTKSLWGKYLIHESGRKYEFRLEFQVDPQNRVQELNEDNNVWTRTSRAPDLVVETVSFIPSDPDMYSKVFVRLDISNRGHVDAWFQGALVDFRIEGEDIHRRGEAGDVHDVHGERINVIRSGENVIAGLKLIDSGELDKGCYRVIVTVDPDNLIPEEDETNNTKIGYLSMEGTDCSSLKADDSSRTVEINRRKHKQSDSKRIGPAFRMR